MGSIFLRAFEADDYILINMWRNDPEIQKLISTHFKYVSLEVEKEWVRNKMMNNTRDIYLAICLNDNTKEMIGYASINDIDYVNRSAHGGGVVIGNSKYRDGGVKHEVGVKIRELVFGQLNLNRFTGACLAEHKISRVMMEAAGYQLEGVRRQAIYKDGKYHDSMLFSLLREDYYRLLEERQYTLVAFAKKVKAINTNMRSNEDN